MKNKLLFLLLTLFIVPTISIGAEMRTLDVEFTFAPYDNQANQLLGYRLYKEGQQVCQTTDPSSSRITCELFTDDGTFDFSLTAHYSDGTESPPSPSFPFTIASVSGTPTPDSTTATTPTTPTPDSTTATPPTAVLSTSTAVGNAPLNVTFNGTSSTTSNSSIVSYNWTFGDGTQATGETTSHTFTTAGTYYTQLIVVDSRGLSDTVTTPIVVTAASLPNATPENNLNIEIGTVSIDHEWVRVDFQNTFSEPIVVASPPTSNGTSATPSYSSLYSSWFTRTATVEETQPALVRIRNIDQEGFEIRIQEWDYLDGSHPSETVSYIVLEKGAHTLDNGIKLEAGSFTGSTSFQQVNLKQTYNDIPVILTQVMTDNGTDAITNRVKDINQLAFLHKIQEQESTQTAHPEAETIGYIAWEPGQGEVDGLLYETGITARSVDQDWFDLTFQTEFPDLPFFFAGMQTTYGGDTAAVRTQNISNSATQIKVEEEQSLDSEMEHTNEVMGYFSIGSAQQQ